MKTEPDPFAETPEPDSAEPAADTGEPAGSVVDDVGDALREWDREVEAQDPNGEAENLPAAPDDWERHARERGLSSFELETLARDIQSPGDVAAARHDLATASRLEREALFSVLEERNAAFHQARDASDFSRLVDTLKTQFPQIGNRVQAVLVGIFHSDPKFAAAWEGRHSGMNPDSPIPITGQERWRRVVETIRGDLHEMTRGFYDREITADREAVAHAVRGAGGGPRAASPPPNLGKMSDAEFAAHTEQEFGFTPRLD